MATIVLIDTLCGALDTHMIARVREWQGDYTDAFIGMAILATVSAMMVVSLTRTTAESESPTHAN